jgi:signal transduction histidine kinase
MDTTEKAFYSALLIALGIVGVILLFFIISIIQQQRRYRAMALAKINAEITTLENERKRIASDLHDEVGPLLSAVKLHINHLDKSEGEQQKELIVKSSLYIDEVIKKMREISNDLLPNILIRKGFPAAAEDFLTKVTKGSGLKVTFESDLQERVALEKEVNLYRIVQEIVHNTMKHAKASEIQIKVSKSEGRVILATADNGVGLPGNVHQRKEAGLGLLNLQSRTDVMGGELSFKTAPGKGTSYLFEIPLA